MESSIAEFLLWNPACEQMPKNALRFSACKFKRLEILHRIRAIYLGADICCADFEILRAAVWHGCGLKE